MYLSTLIVAISLTLGATAAPSAPALGPSCGIYNRAALFEAWTTLCDEVATGHSTGMNIVDRSYEGLCFPLPDEIRGLKVNELSEGCRVVAFKSPVCDDYPYQGAYIDKLGCLFTGGSRYRSYKLQCEAKE